MSMLLGTQYIMTLVHFFTSIIHFITFYLRLMAIYDFCNRPLLAIKAVELQLRFDFDSAAVRLSKVIKVTSDVTWAADPLATVTLAYLLI